MTREMIIANEVVNSITHGIGLGLSIAGLVLMVVQAGYHGTPASIVSSAVFGASLVLLYASSMLYHGAWNKRHKVWLNKLDHSMIYVLIAGTHTPLALVTLNGAWGWTIFGLIWAQAIGGVLFKLFWYKSKYRKISALTYVLMGLTLFIAVYPLFKNMSPLGFTWIMIGNGVYVAGVFFYLAEKTIPFAHGVFHLFVMGGSISHFFGIYHHVLPNLL